MLHCRSVSLRDVTHPLTPDEIRSEVPGREVYHLTDILVLRNGDDHAVCRLQTTGRGLMREVDDVEVLSLPDDTVAVDRPDLDVFNPSAMARVVEDHDGATVVVHGRYGYTGVARPGPVRRVAVVDLVPPDDPRLLEMARALLLADPPPTPVVLEPHLVDAEEETPDSDDPVLQPCVGRAAGPYLDRGPDLTPDEADRAVVVGCELSRRIFLGLYGTEPELVDVCPLSNAPDGPCLARCCLVQDVERKDGTVVVPWGADHGQVRRALRLLAGDGERGAE